MGEAAAGSVAAAGSEPAGATLGDDVKLLIPVVSCLFNCLTNLQILVLFLKCREALSCVISLYLLRPPENGLGDPRNLGNMSSWAT